MTDTLLSLDNVTVRSRGEVVFEGLDFSVKKGEQWAIVSESAEDKSLFLDALAGKLIVSKGTLSMPFLLDGETEKELPLYASSLVAEVASRWHFQRLSHANYYYQQRFNSFDMEASETVVDYLNQITADEKKAWTKETASRQLKLASILGKRLVMLSSGETKRLLIAAALLQNPVLLLLDHPFAGLDVQTRKELDDTLTEIVHSGIHIVTTASHKEMPSAITHVAVLEKKSISKRFPVDKLQTETLPFVADAPVDTTELLRLLQTEQKEKHQVIVEMKNVAVRYGEKLILERINWKILPGERWALQGRNGAGKSTLLSLINADNPQGFANKMTLFDRPKGSGESIWDIKRKIGFAAPELIACFPAGHSCLNVVESGFYDTPGLFRVSDPAKVAVAERWLKVLGIESTANKLFRNVSASEQRLCLFVRALVKGPTLLILDEPFQGLDEALKERMKTLLEIVCTHTDVTLIYVSHYQSDIPACVEHVLALENGRVIEHR